MKPDLMTSLGGMLGEFHNLYAHSELESVIAITPLPTLALDIPLLPTLQLRLSTAMKYSTSGSSLGQSTISKPLSFVQTMRPPPERLCLHDPRSATFIADAIEFVSHLSTLVHPGSANIKQLLRGPHKVVPGTIPSGMSLALMAWGIVRAFEVCDDLDEYDDDSESEYDEDEMNDDWTEESYYVSYDDYESDSTSTPDSSGPSTPNPYFQHASTYGAAVVHLNTADLPLADHEWPAVFGKRGEPPVRSRWLVPFEETAQMLQHKAFMVAHYISL